MQENSTHNPIITVVRDPEHTLGKRFDVNSAEFLFSSLWRSSDQIHFIGMLDRQTGIFHNKKAPGISEAVANTQASSAMRQDAYLACAEFASSQNRTSENAAGAWAFWVDIDCGPDKPYSDTDDANAALKKFSTYGGLPEPTHLVQSGSGVHAYWVLDTFLERGKWQTYATKLKGLMKTLGLHADPSRTADIASVLRVPGTLNYKYDPPCPVTLLSATEEYIPLAEMLDALDAAVVEEKVEVKTLAPAPKPGPVVPLPLADASLIEPPDLTKLESALKALDPDCDEHTWKFHRLAPLATLVRAYPVLADRMCALAISWSSGDLRGVPSIKWCKPGGNGLSGEHVFDSVWRRLLTNNYQGKCVTVGTIYFHARAAGWVYEPGNVDSVAFEGVAVL